VTNELQGISSAQESRSGDRQTDTHTHTETETDRVN